MKHFLRDLLIEVAAQIIADVIAWLYRCAATSLECGAMCCGTGFLG